MNLSEYKPLQTKPLKGAFKKYKPRSLFLEFYGTWETKFTVSQGTSHFKGV